MADDDYEQRKGRFGLADRDDVKEAVEAGNVVWLDVRSQGEVDQDKIPVDFIHIPVTMTDVSKIKGNDL